MTALAGRDKYRHVTGWPDQVALSRILTDICKNQDIATMLLPEGARAPI